MCPTLRAKQYSLCGCEFLSSPKLKITAKSDVIIITAHCLIAVIKNKQIPTVRSMMLNESDTN